jgi:hypothetical protein
MFDSIENQIKRAEHAINDLSKNPNECEWFQILLDLLKDEKKVVVYGKNGKPLRVTRIAYTMYTASFFDVYHIRHLINFEIKPEEIDEELTEIAGFGFYGKFFD